MTTKREEFPATIYVVRVQDRDTSYLECSDEFSGFAVVDDERKVAIYKLAQVAKLKSKAELS